MGIDDSGPITPLRRIIHGESRDRSIHLVTAALTNAVFIADLIMESKHIHHPEPTQNVPNDIIAPDIMPTTESERTVRLKWLSKIYTGIVGAIDGIKNLCDTYSADVNILAQLVVLTDLANVSAARITAFLAQQGILLGRPRGHNH